MPRTLALALALALAAAPLAAQRGARVEITLPAPAQRAAEAPYVRAADVLGSGSLRDLLHNGFPARLHFRLELWSTGGWFNSLKGRTEWDLVVRYSALEKRYTVARLVNDRVVILGSYDQLRGAEEAVEQPFQPPFRPGVRRGSRYYYFATLDVELISVSDLDEVERWLSGELQPSLQGRKNPGTALSRGVGTLFSRLLGGERRHYEARSGKFSGE